MSNWIVIPAKNEADTIKWLVTEAIQYGEVLVVVDKDTNDGTVDKAVRAGAWVIYQREQGLGAAIRTGWREALARDADRVVVMDAGGSHSPSDIPSLIASHADIVIGSRFVHEGHYYGRPLRKLCSQTMAMLCNLAQPGQWIRDWTSGFRCYSAEAVRQLLYLPYKAIGHAWQIEALAWARILCLSIGEVPIDYIAGRSSLDLSKAWEAIKVWFSLWSIK